MKTPEPLLEVHSLSKRFYMNNSEIIAIETVSFVVARGQFVSLIGPSGCGKTTLLLCLAGLLTPSAGQVVLHGRTVKQTPREMAIVFQDYSRSLFPWKSVLGNVLFGMRRRSELSSREKEAEAYEYLASVGLAEFARRYPWELSGGMQQRLAIARALAGKPEIILMDEPFGSVDAQTRADLQDFLLNIWQRFSQTILLVTHDIEEAIYLSERVLILTNRPARIQADLRIQLDYPRNQITTREDPRFIEYLRCIYDTIRSERNSVSATPAVERVSIA
jgi:NitT/TauT family transport system ATP-binding protein